MKRDRFTVGILNKISMLRASLDSATAIEISQMSETERHELRALLTKAYDYLHKKIEIK
jgi:hypothetical protein